MWDSPKQAGSVERQTMTSTEGIEGGMSGRGRVKYHNDLYSRVWGNNSVKAEWKPESPSPGVTQTGCLGLSSSPTLGVFM